MNPLHLHFWLQNFKKWPLDGRVRMVHADAPGTPTTETEADDAPSPPSSDEDTRELLKKIDDLKAKKELSEDAAELAKKELQSSDAYGKKLATRLAEGEIVENEFQLAHDTLKSDRQAKKALAKKFIDKKLPTPIFEQAIDDLESGDTYRAPLARRLALGQIQAKDFELARKGLTETDVDKKWASQSLALGHIQANQFREKMKTTEAKAESTKSESESATETQPKDPIASTQKEIHDKILEVLLQTNVVIEQLPEEERTRPLNRLRSDLENLNNRDRANNKTMVFYLRTLKEENELSNANIKTILEFDAKEKKDLKKLRTQLEEMGLPKIAVKNLMKLKEEEYNIEKDFVQQSKVTANILKAVVNVVHYETRKESLLRNGEKMTGIRLKEGTQIQYPTLDPSRGNIATHTISKVEILDAPILDGIGEDANVLGIQPVGFTISLDNGEQHTIGRFAKWVDAMDAYENISNKKALEETLGLPQIGMELQSGHDVEFTQSYNKDSQGNLVPNRTKVGIVSIDDQKVVLSEPVITLRPEAAPHAGLTAPRMAREMSLGEFAKWARRNDTIPQINTLEELREHLRQYNANFNQTLKRDPQAFPPITVEPGEVLQFGGGRPKGPKDQIQIKKADDEGVTFMSGDKMTLPQFLGWVRDKRVERSNPEDRAEREGQAAENLGEAIKKDASGKAMLDAMKDVAEKSEPDESGKSFFEKISAFIPQESEIPHGFDVFFAQYTIVSVMDIINLGKEIIEFIKRKHTRRSQHRYSTIGKSLPSMLGTEFERVNQQSETDEVNKYKEAMAQWGTWQILGKLHETSSKDEAKACFMALSEKGELRWDDIEMWKALNGITAGFTADGAKLYIKPTLEAQPHPDNPNRKVSGEDLVQKAIDALWGEGQYAEWYSKNGNTYNTNIGNYVNKGRQLEADPKGTEGLRGELRRLLSEWKSGNYVNPEEYEGLIDYAIDAGKMSMEQKLFFLLEGITAECPSGAAQGQTLLHIDRVGVLDGKYLNKLPLLDYFTNKGAKPFHPRYLSGEITLKQTEKGYRKEDYESIRDTYYKSESDECLPGTQFSKFLWERAMVDPNFKTRLSKGLRAAQNIDHEDAPFFIPPGSMEEIRTLTGSFTGIQKYFTSVGYMNGYVGFSQFIISMSNRYDDLVKMRAEGKPITEEMIEESKQQIVGGLQSYCLYDAYLSQRLDRSNDQRARLDQEHYNRTCPMDPKIAVGRFKTQLDNVLKELCEAYEIPQAEQNRFLNHQPKYNDKVDQAALDQEMRVFLETTLPGKIKSDNGEKMLKVITKRKLKAIEKIDDIDAIAGIESSNRILTNPEYIEQARKMGFKPSK